MSGTTIASGARRRTLGATCCALAAAALFAAVPAVPIASAATAAPQGVQPSGQAPGGPGAQSYLDVARKDCFGTARNTTSKVWFTVAGGVLSDVFSPNIEATNVNTVQYIVTDGHTLRRSAAARHDLFAGLARPQRHGLPGHEHRPRARLPPRQRLHHRSGAGQRRSCTRRWRRSAATRTPCPSSRSTCATTPPSTTAAVAAPPTAAPTTPPSTRPAPRWSPLTRPPRTGPFAAQVVGALVADRPFLAESSGFVGTPSDGLNQLDTHHRLVNDYRSATDGNVVQTALLDTTPGPAVHARAGLRPDRERRRWPPRSGSAAQPFAHDAVAIRGGLAWLRRLAAPPAGQPRRASPAPRTPRCRAPTGCRPTSSRPPRTRPTSARSWPRRPTHGARRCRPSTTHAGWTYREVFARDSYETFTGLLADGDTRLRARHGRCSCSTRPSSPTAASRATPSSTARSRPTRSGCRRSTRSPTRC